MGSVGVLTTFPTDSYLEQELERRFKVFKLRKCDHKLRFINDHKHVIRAVVVNGAAGVDAGLVEALPNLQIVASFSAGLDKIDVDNCKQKGIQVTNTPDVSTDDVADLGSGLILAVLRKICDCYRYVKRWQVEDGGLQFTGKSVGIIGLGRIGKAIAERAEAFSCRISYHSRTEKPESGYTFYPNVVDLASDFGVLVVACSLTEESRHIVNRKVIDALGPEGVVINVSRGPLVDEPELVSALVESRIGGAGLDLFENEPAVPKQLVEFENVVLLPHVGSATVETRKAMADLVVGNLEAHFQNKPLLSPVL